MTIDTKILTTLRGAGNGGVAGTELSQKLGISRAAVWAHIQELRALGYEIEASPHLGYRLVNVPDVLHSDHLLSSLGRTKVVGRDIRVFEETTSTNDIVEKLAHDGVPEGVVVFAESQTQGRGRLGRKWISPPRKGLWFSILLRPQIRPAAVTQLTIAAATALFRAIHAADRHHRRNQMAERHPDSRKKDGGHPHRTERRTRQGQIRHPRHRRGRESERRRSFPPDLRKLATSLKIESGVHQNRAALAVKILQELDHDYDRVCSGKFEAVANEWEEHCSTIGHRVAIHIGDRKIQGCAESLDTDGALLLRTQHGRLERIIGGDVTVEK